MTDLQTMPIPELITALRENAKKQFDDGYIAMGMLLNVMANRIKELHEQVTSEKHYLITVHGDVDPELSEPMARYDEVVQAGKAHRAQDTDLYDGLYYLKIVDGKPEIDSFGGEELEVEDA